MRDSRGTRPQRTPRVRGLLELGVNHPLGGRTIVSEGVERLQPPSQICLLDELHGNPAERVLHGAHVDALAVKPGSVR